MQMCCILLFFRYAHYLIIHLLALLGPADDPNPIATVGSHFRKGNAEEGCQIHQQVGRQA